MVECHSSQVKIALAVLVLNHQLPETVDIVSETMKAQRSLLFFDGKSDNWLVCFPIFLVFDGVRGDRRRADACSPVSPKRQMVNLPSRSGLDSIALVFFLCTVKLVL